MVTNKQIALLKAADTSANSVYTSPASDQGGAGTVITQFMATDPAGTATYSVYIGAAATASTKVISSRTAAIDGDSPTSILNGMIRPGEQLFLEASATDIVFNVAGIERR